MKKGSKEEKINLLARKLVEEVNKHLPNGTKEVKHIDIFWDFDHQSKREIHTTSLGEFEFIQKLDIKNENFKE
jgi:hypothetical protein